MQITNLTAAIAYDRYAAAFEADTLTQGAWHTERDGRQLACALGVLGDDIEGLAACPASVMPRWLAQMTIWFFDHQKFADAKLWGLAFYAELKRLDGNVPFSVIHDWHARHVGPLAVIVAKVRGRAVEPHKVLMEMHTRAAAGETFSKAKWVAVLRPAYVYTAANAYANALTYSNDNADDYADACAYTDACAYANAYPRSDAFKRLADGMVDCLSRVAS